MKNLIMASFVFMSLNCYSQIGIRAGIATSYFNQGDASHKGISHNYQSITAGFYHKSKHLQIELDYLQQGAHNPKNNDRTFKTYYISLPVTYVAHMHNANFQIGGYVSRLVGASNYDLFDRHDSFGWHVSQWRFWQSYDYGLVAGMGVNLHPINLELHYRQGIRSVRHDLNGWNGLPDYSYWKSRNAAIDLALYIPFNLNKK